MDAPAPLTPLPISQTPRRGGLVGLGGTVLLVAALVGLAGLVLAGRVLAAPPWWLAVGVLLLPYLWAGHVLVTFVAWSLWPDRRALGWLQALSVCCGVALYGASWAARPEQAEGEPVRVMSWNVRRLWGGPEDGGDATACVVEVVREVDPDVLTLLEVSADDVATLSAALGLDCRHGTYRKGGGPTRGGLAVCARGERVRLLNGGAQRFVDSEDWAYVYGELTVGERVFNVLSVHLVPYSFYLGARRQRPAVQEVIGVTEPTVRAQSDQAAALLERVAKFKDPTVLAGDFNSTRDMSLHASLRRTLTDVWERGGMGFGSTADAFGSLPVRVDFMYASTNFAVAGAKVVQRGCADHRPVVGELTLKAAP